jgi:CHASE1-domain containing sensor protein
MPGSVRPTSPRVYKSRLLPWVVLLSGFAISIAIWLTVRLELQRQDAARFERLKERVLVAIDARFLAAEQALYAGRTLVEATGEPTHQQWVGFVKSVSRFFDQGVVGIGYVQRVPRSELDAIEARVRAAGRPEFTVERDGTDPQVFLVMQMEPISRNARALGKDVGSGATDQRD